MEEQIDTDYPKTEEKWKTDRETWGMRRQQMLLLGPPRKSGFEMKRALLSPMG
ncbi:hypothetical protein J1N35_024513 [Gossypium stocksii]|uniref:Uncharacterized protein n=1 Tax=Gossypium stocksii TaxID=47602 RepID=A0A9D3V599_9ROSI|nr:hypothetical protein J1N35_024513 [Gossypium stocksii]